MDVETIAQGLVAAVPFARTVGIEVVEVAPDGSRAVVRMPDAEAVHNHVGGPHAGALFTLAETASGAVVLASFGHLLDRAVPLAVRAEIAYRKLAMGPVSATATLRRPVADVEAELAAGERPEFEIGIDVIRADGAVTAEMTAVWTLRPQ